MKQISGYDFERLAVIGELADCLFYFQPTTTPGVLTKQSMLTVICIARNPEVIIVMSRCFSHRHTKPM